MTASDRLLNVLGVLDETLPYWLRHAMEPVAYVLGFIAGLIDIVFNREARS